MKVTDFIVEFLVAKGVTDVFGYPGGVICHFIDSLSKYDEINGHINYHEQASAFAACGYAQESGRPGVAYSTSGPGATNLITGIANAYYDSIPTIFLTGQVDTYALKGELNIRQRGFQETSITELVAPITKYAVRVDDSSRIRYELEKAWHYAIGGNPGPVLLDLPADVQRALVDKANLEQFDGAKTKNENIRGCVDEILLRIGASKRPCFLLGCGIKQSGLKEEVKHIVESLDIPVVASMPAVDILSKNSKNCFGFIGANGHRYGNFVLGKCDLIIAIGTRLDLKQVGNDRNEFAKQATIIRVDIDSHNLEYRVHEDEIQFQADIREVLPAIKSELEKKEMPNFSEWNRVCNVIKEKLQCYDDKSYTSLISALSEVLPDGICITADVGQSEVWVAQKFGFKENQSFHISSGHGAMGYSLPAAIGVYYANRKPVVCFNGDGGIQMNLQELQFLSREQIPITIVIINNHSLGMIRGFQEENFEKNYQQTTETTGYTVPDYERIADAYGIDYQCVSNEKEVKRFVMNTEKPQIVEMVIDAETTLEPNFGRSGFIQDQRPYLDRAFYEGLMNI